MNRHASGQTLIDLRRTQRGVKGSRGMPFDLPTNFDASLHQIVQAVVTILAVINPVVCGSIFLTLTTKLAPAQKRSAAIRVALSILIILVASALVGLKVLGIFGISLDVFRIVGGMIIAYMGFDMLRGRQTVGQASIPTHPVCLPFSLCLRPVQGRSQPW